MTLLTSLLAFHLNVLFKLFPILKLANLMALPLFLTINFCTCTACNSSNLALFFIAMLCHGYMASQLRDLTLVPIPKSGEDPSTSEGYRAIALAPALSKVLKWCLLFLYPSYFSSSGLQFRTCQPHCSGVVKNVVSYYVHNGTNVYACLLNASKPFNLRFCSIVLWRRIFQGL